MISEGGCPILGNGLGDVSQSKFPPLGLVFQCVVDATIAFSTIPLAHIMLAVMSLWLAQVVTAISIVDFPSAVGVARGTGL